ncbi:hypothetical protein DPEC_G00124980 [Dallia pectoralis]|uniref:Uncharacterized protein n=1 Tax=Dallia pectoralis TaxID=75939 RepID=A0ACC2GR70_DALPE|nr:hypothetical protein DPEC_G00124980 [Dallia pectoralis]
MSNLMPFHEFFLRTRAPRDHRTLLFPVVVWCVLCYGGWRRRCVPLNRRIRARVMGHQDVCSYRRVPGLRSYSAVLAPGWRVTQVSAALDTLSVIGFGGQQWTQIPGSMWHHAPVVLEGKHITDLSLVSRAPRLSLAVPGRTSG